jgi:putative salt-induced outer membrane protein YdiY
MAGGLVLAQETAPASPLKMSLDLGATLTDGNSDSTKANGSLNLQAERESLGSILAGIQGNYGESEVDGERQTDVENAKAFINAKKTLTPKAFAYGESSILYDDIAEIDYRLTVGPGAGCYLVKSATDTASVEAGPSYIWEKVAGVKDDYLALRLASRYEHVFAESAKCWLAAEYLPEAADFGNYLVNAEAGAEAALNARMSLKLVVQDKYDSEPGEDLEKNDVLFIGGISVKL